MRCRPPVYAILQDLDASCSCAPSQSFFGFRCQNLSIWPFSRSKGAGVRLLSCLHICKKRLAPQRFPSSRPQSQKQRHFSLQEASNRRDKLSNGILQNGRQRQKAALACSGWLKSVGRRSSEAMRAANSALPAKTLVISQFSTICCAVLLDVHGGRGYAYPAGQLLNSYLGSLFHSLLSSQLRTARRRTRIQDRDEDQTAILTFLLPRCYRHEHCIEDVQSRQLRH